MKKTLFTLIAISFVSLSYFAQNFEGEITYETTYKTMPEITSTRIVSMSKDDFYKGEQTSINTKMNTSHFSVWIMKNDTVFSYNDFRENICSYFTKVETQKLNTDTIHNNTKLYRLKDTDKFAVFERKQDKKVSNKTILGFLVLLSPYKACMP